MRLDKYLKVSRLIKRRTLAKNAADGERILVNNNLAKPSKELKIGDIITIEFGLKRVIVKGLYESDRASAKSLMSISEVVL